MENFIVQVVQASLYENYIWSLFLNPNYYNFEYWRSELGLDWLLQHFHRCDWHNSLLCHIYYQFSYFFHHISHSRFILILKCYTYAMDMKFASMSLTYLRYYKINSNRYTYMRKNSDIYLQTTISLVFGGLK
jgi:hypothetical protein